MMPFLRHKTTKWYARGIAAFVVFWLFSLLLIARSQSIFERALNSLYISFDDFNPEYTKALTAAGRDQFDYDFPPAHPHSTDLIPPIIHFIWFKDLYAVREDATPIPHSGSDAPETCKQRNPDWTINVWNATAGRALLEEHYRWFLPTYDNYRHPIQRVDAVKYFILWHYGGIYMDLDVSCRKSLTPLIQQPAWFPRASPLGVNNDIMASRAGHPLMWRMVDSLRRRDKNLLFPWVTIFWTTGPKFTSDMLQEYLSEHGTFGSKGEVWKNQDANAVYVLPREFYSEEFTFFGHSPGGTWHGKDVAVILWIVDRPYVLLLIPVLAVVFVFVCLRKRKGAARRSMQLRRMDGARRRSTDGEEEEEIV